MQKPSNVPDFEKILKELRESLKDLEEEIAELKETNFQNYDLIRRQTDGIRIFGKLMDRIEGELVEANLALDRRAPNVPNVDIALRRVKQMGEYLRKCRIDLQSSGCYGGPRSRGY